jgi:hypothetical protein
LLPIAGHVIELPQHSSHLAEAFVEVPSQVLYEPRSDAVLVEVDYLVASQCEHSARVHAAHRSTLPILGSRRQHLDGAWRKLPSASDWHALFLDDEPLLWPATQPRGASSERGSRALARSPEATNPHLE